MESWRELWVFRANATGWTIDVLSPGADDPEEGYVEYAGFVPGARRLLIARAVMDHGRFRRRFEELRLDDLALVRQANASELLPEFGRWQDVDWRRDTLALH
jgi:ribosomal protein S18 acetylase RimI-like enzyme